MTTTMRWYYGWSIRIALDEDGMTQKELAEKLGWQESKLSRVIKRRQELTVGELGRVAEAQGRGMEFYLNPPDYTAISVNPGYHKAIGIYRQRVYAAA